MSGFRGYMTGHAVTLEQRARAYQNWLRSLPHTLDQIADALEDLARGTPEVPVNPFTAGALRYRADQARKGNLNGRTYSEALKVLIKTCTLCGKTALYRTGGEGRCREHKHIMSAPVAAKLARGDTRAKVHAKLGQVVDKVRAHHKARKLKNSGFK